MEPREEQDCCKAEEIFEFADGGLGPERRREVARHLEGCERCQARYERERRLSCSFARTGVPETGVPEKKTSSVSREVAISLATRSPAARVLWGLLAFGILLSAAAASSLSGDGPVVFAVRVSDLLWGTVSEAASLAVMALAFFGPALLVALAVGAAVDALIAGAVFSAIRRRQDAPGQARRV